MGYPGNEGDSITWGPYLGLLVMLYVLPLYCMHRTLALQGGVHIEHVAVMAPRDAVLYSM